MIILFCADATLDVAARIWCTPRPENNPAGDADEQRGSNDNDGFPAHFRLDQEAKPRRRADDLQLAENQTKDRVLALVAVCSC